MIDELIRLIKENQFFVICMIIVFVLYCNKKFKMKKVSKIEKFSSTNECGSLNDESSCIANQLCDWSGEDCVDSKCSTYKSEQNCNEGDDYSKENCYWLDGKCNNAVNLCTVFGSCKIECVGDESGKTLINNYSYCNLKKNEDGTHKNIKVNNFGGKMCLECNSNDDCKDSSKPICIGSVCQKKSKENETCYDKDGCEGNLVCEKDDDDDDRNCFGTCKKPKEPIKTVSKKEPVEMLSFECNNDENDENGENDKCKNQVFTDGVKRNFCTEKEFTCDLKRNEDGTRKGEKKKAFLANRCIQCKVDKHCDGNKVCTGGMCMDKQKEGKGCFDSTDCEDNLTCVKDDKADWCTGTCKSLLNENKDSRKHMLCNISDGKECHCENDKDCLNTFGKDTKNKKCVPYTNKCHTDGKGVKDHHLSMAKTCQQCYEDSHCKDGEYCNDVYKCENIETRKKSGEGDMCTHDAECQDLDDDWNEYACVKNYHNGKCHGTCKKVTAKSLNKKLREINNHLIDLKNM